MASLNVTSKVLEPLNQLREKDVHSSNYINSKKEKLHACTQIVETLIGSNSETLMKFTNLLELSIDTFLDLCDDQDADVRTVAEESLNKIIKGLGIGYIKKVQVQLYQEIKKNGPARSLRAAIWRFGQLSHTIWPVKGKAYVSNLIPCFSRIISRNEETVLETLANSFPLIMKSLGSFMNDKDVQILLEAILPRLTSSNAVYRRCAVNMILSVCLNSRKSQYFLSCVMDYVVNLLSSSSENIQVIGSFGCLKSLLPCLKPPDSESDTEKLLNNLIIIYEYCLHYTKSSNHNVINAALETLSQLLQMQLVDLTYKFTSEGLANLKTTVPKETIFNFTTSFDTEEIALSSLQSDSSDSKNIFETCSEKAIEKEEEDDSVTEFCDFRGSSESISGDTETKASDPTFELEMKRDAIPLKNCCHQLVSSFLLSGQVGNVISDDIVRVSVKSLTLVTIGHIFKFEPTIFFETLTTSDNNNCQQQIRDVLLFADHPDPQIRGNVSVVVALVIKAVFFNYNNSFSNLQDTMFSSQLEKDKFLDCLIAILIKGLEDISAITCRQTLIALNICLKDLLLSAQSNKAERILNCFGKVAKNPYFLVKVKLTEVLAHLPYNVIQFVTASTAFQSNSLSFLVALIGDQDHRVRHAASTAIINIINRLHCCKKMEDLTFNLAMDDSSETDSEYNLTGDQMSCLISLNEFKKVYSNSTNEKLSKIIGLLTETFLVYESKPVLLGCCETLSRLSVVYSPIIYPKAWDCLGVKSPANTIISLSNSLISSTLHLLVCSSVSLDLMVHKHLLLLAGNLVSAMFIHNYKHDELSGTTNRSSFEFVELWEVMKNDELNQCYKQLLAHTLKLLNIYVHVIENVPWVSEKTQFEDSPKSKLSFDLKSKKKVDKSPAKEISNVINSRHYIDMYGILKAAHNNYNVTLEPEASEMYLSLLNTCLEVLCQLLNLASVQDASLIMEELLRYLQSTSNLAMEKSIGCVQQLFKSIFNANLMSQLKQHELAKNLQDIHSYIESSETENDSNKKLYMRYLYSTTQQISNILTAANNKFKDTNDSRRQDKNFVASVIRNIVQNREKKSSVINSIKLFEPMVIKALTQYTHMQNNSVPLQSQVLKLLSQLIKLHINYCSLDSDNVFINFVIKQFELIGDGHVSECEILLPNILDFLVNLSYTSNHSKLVISVPNIIQLCDGLMASGQPPTSHIIPALIPVVEDIFIGRHLDSTQTAAEQLELDTTREVVYTMLFKLADYHQVVDLLIICLRETELNDQQGASRWKRCSQLAVQALVEALKSQSLRIETRGAYLSFVKLFAVINEDAFQPIDPFLTILLDKTNLSSVPERLLERKRWAGSVNVIMLLLISKSNEKDILQRLTILREDTSEVTFANLIFFFIKIVSSWISQLRKCCHLTSPVETPNLYHESTLYLLEQLTLFLQLCIYLFGCESYSRIAQASEQLVNEQSALSEVHQQVLKVGQYWPIVACKWIHIMTLLKCNLLSFWSTVFKPSNDHQYHEMNRDVVSRMAVILFYDYVCQESQNGENLFEWFINNYSNQIVLLANQLPSTKLSKLSSFLLNQKPNFEPSAGPSFFNNLLICFESARQSQSGALIFNLVLILPRIKYVALSLKAVTICCQRIEILLNVNSKNSITEQLSDEQFRTMVQTIETNRKTFIKHEKLVGLINKLGAQFYPWHTKIISTEKMADEDRTEAKTADKEWFVSKVKKQCSKNTDYLAEVAQLLSKLEADDCRNIMNSSDFNIKLLRNCLILGARLTVEQFQNAKSLLHSSLYDVARNCLFEKIKLVNEQVPKSDMIISTVLEQVSNGTLDTKTLDYYREIVKFFNDSKSWCFIFQLIPSVITYIKILETLPDYNINYINHQDKQELIEFSSVCSGLLQWIFYKSKIEADYMPKPHELELCLQCIECINKEPSSIAKDLNATQHYLKVCSLARAIVQTLEFFVEVKAPMTRIQSSALDEARKNKDTKVYAEACLDSANLVVWLENQVSTTDSLPNFVKKLIKSVIVSLCRQTLVNSFVLIPPQAWNHYHVTGTGSTKCNFPIMSAQSNLLNEADILQQFIYRIILLGWTNRLQFEEMWMALLSVVNNVYQTGDDSGQTGDISQLNVLLIRAISRLVLQMLLLPVPGNPNSSTPVYTARDPQPLSFIQNYDKLFRLQDLILWKYEDLNFFNGNYAFKVEHVFLRGNIERKNNVHEYSYSQVSVPYLWSQCGLHETKSDIGIQELVRRTNQTLKTETIDLQSCLQFLLELYTSWTNYCLPLFMRNEIIKSLQSISELFLKRYQFQWMLDTCLAMLQMHSFEDVIFLQYIVFAASKAAAVLTPLDKDTQDKVLLLLETASKSSFLSVRISAAHSVLYLLQGSTLLHCNDLTNSITSIASEQIHKFQSHLDPVDLSINEELSSVMWALIFFILEHVKDVKTNVELASTVEHALATIENPKISTSLHQTIVQGLERLVLVRPIEVDLFNKIIRVAIDNLKQPNPIISMPAIQLLLSCMYVEAAQAGTLSISLVDEVELENKPEMLVKSIERSSVLFDKIKKAYNNEVEILCEVVSGIFNDFFFTSNILTKVIGEFLSMQQQHPKLMSSVVFKVCERTNNSSQLDLLQEWVLFSLPNFIDNLPIAMSTWFLSCFFVSLSKNPWLQNLFPHVQCRIGKYEFEDKSILSMAAMDFYQQLTSDTRKEEFIRIFNVAGKKLGSPFNDVAICFQ